MLVFDAELWIIEPHSPRKDEGRALSLVTTSEENSGGPNEMKGRIASCQQTECKLSTNDAERLVDTPAATFPASPHQSARASQHPRQCKQQVTAPLPTPYLWFNPQPNTTKPSPELHLKYSSQKTKSQVRGCTFGEGQKGTPKRGREEKRQKMSRQTGPLPLPNPILSEAHRRPSR